jgi:serine/threonine-protein kinase
MAHCLRCDAALEPDYKACPKCGEPITDFIRRYTDTPVDGKYKLLQRLGTGGMGEVYKVHHTWLGSDRVIKVIRSQISGSGDAHDRFLREARVATKVQHPNVATLHDFSALPDGAHYMVWEFIDGENLAQVLRHRGTLSPLFAMRIAIEALHGLDAIHKAGIVHRDISPENLMITRDEAGDEHVKIIDLGVAKFDDAGHAETKTGIFVGKLRYASPEQLGFLPENEKIDGRADLYSMAIVMYEMLTGRPPFEATSPHQYILHHSKETAMRTLELPRDLPGGAELQDVIARAMEPQRAKRFASAREFAAALEAIERSLPAPVDADSTMRLTPPPATLAQQDTLHRSTVRSAVKPPPTRNAAATIIDRAPLPPKPKTSRVATAALIVIILIGAAAGYVMLRRPPEAATPQTTSAAATPAPKNVIDGEQSSTSMNVVAPPTATTVTQVSAPLPAPAPAVAPATTTVAPPRREPQPVPQPQPVEPQPQPAPAFSGATYVEGGDNNDGALEELQRAMRGVRRVAVEGNGDAALVRQVADSLRGKVAIVSRSESPDAVIDFNGTVEKMSIGRKRRSAHATISRNGRVVFRYELPPETYRVGDNPAEAFARILGDAIE